MPAAFSRLQLAAALLEYDNDPDDPFAPRRSAQESAIFAHFRRNPAAPPGGAARQSDYLGISLPSDTGSLGGRESMAGTRRSRGSVDALRNPFGADSHDGEEENGEEDMEVDLTSWGLDAFMPKDKSRKGKGKAPSVAATAPPTTTVRSHLPSTNSEHIFPTPRRAVNYSRSMSLGGSADFLRETGNPPLDYRRRSIASPLDVAGMEINRAAFPRQRPSSVSQIQPGAEFSQGVPFPTRATSPGPSESMSGRRGRERAFSMASRNSRMLLADVKEESRPQSLLEGDGEDQPREDNPFALQPPSHTSRFDPKYGAHARTISDASLGTRALLNDDRNSVMTGGGDNFFQRERRYSTTLDLLRPKVLVMPSPLQSVAPPEPPSVDNRIRDGFTLTKDGPPLPPGARSSRRMSTLLGVLDDPPPVASNSFTPNPLNDLTHAQRVFRNTLYVDGQLNAFPDDLPRATEDGEQVQLYPEEIPEIEEPLPPPPPPDPSALKKPPGKLYGKSLIDDLESRKAQMRSKQRVFYGDQRPSMMARRGELQRGGTLIDPATLGRPGSQFLSHSTSAEGLLRRNSGNIKPLLSFDDDKTPQTTPIPGRPMNSHSVFGVDTLWEREMVKLQEIEAQEKIEEEERQRLEGEEERRKAEKKGKKKKGKGKHRVDEFQPLNDMDVRPGDGEQRVSVEPPVLPAIERASKRPPPVDDDDDDESDDDEMGLTSSHQTEEQGWHAGSSDEEDAPRRTTGVGPRYPRRVQGSHPPAGVESDEDLPLAATLNKRMQKPSLRPSRHGDLESDEDEEKPLSSLLEKAKVKSTSSMLDINFDKLSMGGTNPSRVDDGDDDDDNQPLGLRASRIPSAFSNGGNDDDDDRPLGLHPEQQRRTQYEMFAQQQQQQQQQMMMQAQFQNPIFFNPPMMGSGFFPPPITTPMMGPMNPMMMMQPPMSIPSPPPVHDAAKYGRVDKWRRDVAVEGEIQS